MPVIVQTTRKRGIIVGRNRKQVLVHSRTKTVVRTNTRQGVAGPPSDKNYVHDQVLPSSTWTINHNLGKYPAVTFRDSGGSNIMMSYQHISINQVVATAHSAVSGSAECN